MRRSPPFDPLDAAAERFDDPAHEPTDAQAEIALERLQEKDGS